VGLPAGRALSGGPPGCCGSAPRIGGGGPSTFGLGRGGGTGVLGLRLAARARAASVVAAAVARLLCCGRGRVGEPVTDGLVSSPFRDTKLIARPNVVRVPGTAGTAVSMRHAILASRIKLRIGDTSTGDSSCRVRGARGIDGAVYRRANTTARGAPTHLRTSESKRRRKWSTVVKNRRSHLCETIVFKIDGTHERKGADL
jgi:hypothetical protein